MRFMIIAHTIEVPFIYDIANLYIIIAKAILRPRDPVFRGARIGRPGIPSDGPTPRKARGDQETRMNMNFWQNQTNVFILSSDWLKILNIRSRNMIRMNVSIHITI